MLAGENFGDLLRIRQSFIRQLLVISEKAIEAGLKFAKVFFTLACNSPKFSPTKIFCYTVYCSQCFVVGNVVYRIKFRSVIVEIHDIKIGKIKFPIGSPYKNLYYVMYKETRNFAAPISTVER